MPQKSLVEVSKKGKNLSVFMEVSGNNVRVVFDLLGRGKANDHGADPIKRAVAAIFEQPYDCEMQLTLNQVEKPANWLAQKVKEVDQYVANEEAHHMFD